MPDASDRKWYHAVWFVLAMLFFVLGPFGLPLLWKSSAFPRWAKIVLTVAVLAYTAWLVLATLAVVKTLLGSYSDMRAVFP